jgi:hypothetical protein
VTESFFSSLEIERIARKLYRTCDQAGAKLTDYIELLSPGLWARHRVSVWCQPFSRPAS